MRRSHVCPASRPAGSGWIEAWPPQGRWTGPDEVPAALELTCHHPGRPESMPTVQQRQSSIVPAASATRTIRGSPDTAESRWGVEGLQDLPTSGPSPGEIERGDDGMR